VAQSTCPPTNVVKIEPIVTGWMGENHFGPVPQAPTAPCCSAAVAYLILQRAISRSQGPTSALAAAVGRDARGKLSPVLYAVAIPLALVSPDLPARSTRR